MLNLIKLDGPYINYQADTSSNRQFSHLIHTSGAPPEGIMVGERMIDILFSQPWTAREINIIKTETKLPLKTGKTKSTILGEDRHHLEYDIENIRDIVLRCLYKENVTYLDVYCIVGYGGSFLNSEFEGNALTKEYLREVVAGANVCIPDGNREIFDHWLSLNNEENENV